MEITLNTWHCRDCEADFYTNLEDEPFCCPFCRSVELSDFKLLVAEPINFDAVIK